ncbi:uncharacterized protein LOC132933060 [Metopolophium dirhodum]|uniref:uncharacterized protein LOC132933060 n=1 Tax=Metopolophium dirhodum TaxID=44670 RepID=UPI0029905A76|nr:uncharacterized protein LOC132933060 [Metopolophium dirhodum]
MSSEGNEGSQRDERALRRAIAKRNELVEHMKTLYDIALTLQTDKSVIPIFLARNKDVENYVMDLNLETDIILDQLIVLNRDSEYAIQHIPIKRTFMEQYYFITAITSTLGLDARSNAHHETTSSQCQLPKIQLPIFDGELLQWRTFRDTFASLVHDNPTLSQIEKFHYLISSVTGSAASCVRALPLTADNYIIVWNNLHTRYDNKRVLITAHLDSIFRFAPLQKESLSGLQNFLSTFQENIASIRALDINDFEGFLLFYVASRALDSTTKRLFESAHHNVTTPSIDLLLTFIQTRCNILHNSSSVICHQSNKQPQKYVRNKTSLMSLNDRKLCIKCKNTHFLHQCPDFIQCTVHQRFKFAQANRLCMNCLNPQHKTSECISTHTCRQCSGKHHTMLHLDKINKRKELPPNPSADCPSSSVSIPEPVVTPNEAPFSGTTCTSSNVILGTIVIRIRDYMGHWTNVRTLLDTGSQVSVITNACVTRLGLERRQCQTEITGLSQTIVTATKGSTWCTFVPVNKESPHISCEPLILSRITGPMPTMTLDSKIRRTYSHIEFADPHFDTPGPIEFLLGADIYPNIFGNCSRMLHTPGLPSAYETLFGWIILGQSNVNVSTSPVLLLLMAEPSIENMLCKFWELEEPTKSTLPFTDDQRCEDHFKQTTKRDSTGRYSVSFPFRINPSHLGDSHEMALSRFYNLERKLLKDRELYDQYRAFMQEYKDLGHMTIARQPGKYYIPHHAVVKRIGSAVKLRVVFDASAKSSTGKSLNDLLHVGPKLQTDISDLLHRCRTLKYMFTADICKMYRQIKINTDDCTYQHILWRKSPVDQLEEYELLTVTYGVSVSPYQAIRVLHQLEIDSGSIYPNITNILSTQTYVDDIISGHNTTSGLLVQYEELINLLQHGGFELKKWSSNYPALLRKIPEDDRAINISFDPKDDGSVKILGLHWDPIHDLFSYHVSNIFDNWTKRTVLSTIAQLYDPLGALAPVIFWAKYFMQRLWQSGINWDDPLPPLLLNDWKQFSGELHLLSGIKIRRHIHTYTHQSVQLIGFSDASEKGYSSVVYIRCVDSTGNILVYLLTAKSKVAPLKLGKLDNNLTIPRLELCGALLLAQTLHRMSITLKDIIPVIEIHAWTDSKVVLSWLTSPQSNFKIFVTNRLSKIADLLPNCQWRHVSSDLNPADCVSRGIFPSLIQNNLLYWNGPPFLLLPDHLWPSSKITLIPPSQLPEYKPSQCVCNIIVPDAPLEWINNFSSFTRLIRVTAWIIRFCQRTRQKRKLLEPLSLEPLSREELDNAIIPLVITTQKNSFSNLLQTLQVPDAKVSPRSLAQLSPFVDVCGILRVGGRIRQSNAPVTTHHPILLPKESALTTLIIRHFHLTYFHAGAQLTASLLRRRYWILSCRLAIRSVIFKCVICARHRATAPQPLMADLPAYRVRPARPFSHVGIDFAGPFLIKEGRRKTTRSIKCYLCIFVCMVVKASHIEVVSDLSTDAFLASLHRFVSRRGIPSNIYTDCGSNFKGADRQLQLLFSDPSSQSSFIGAIPCKWHFNPPAAPHFGGLWEAAVKSTKYHLRRVIGTQLLTYEELSTLSARVEGILNSRPLTALSTDPNDLCSLSPGDFLIGQPLVAIPESDTTSTPLNRLNRWELIRHMYQSFWKRWSNEYLTSIQSRNKWTHQQRNVKVGDLVLVQTPNQPPTHWKLGRIEEVHPGSDDIVRVVTVRTADSVVKRPVVKLAKLPLDTNPSI